MLVLVLVLVLVVVMLVVAGVGAAQLGWATSCIHMKLVAGNYFIYHNIMYVY